MKKINKHSAMTSLRTTALFAVGALFIFMLAAFTGQPNRTEKLLGISFNYEKKEMTIQVISTGCTVKADFQVKVSNNTITIIRKKRDLCKAMPGMVSFTYTFQETGLSADKLYTIKNGFIANLNLANIN